MGPGEAKVGTEKVPLDGAGGAVGPAELQFRC